MRAGRLRRRNRKAWLRDGAVCARKCKKAGFSYFMKGCRDQSSNTGIILVKAGWLVGMGYRDGVKSKGDKIGMVG